MERIVFAIGLALAEICSREADEIDKIYHPSFTAKYAKYCLISAKWCFVGVAGLSAINIVKEAFD